MWLDQLERDAVQAQETEGNLAQQYQVGLCVCVRVCQTVCLSGWTCTLELATRRADSAYYQLNQWLYTAGIRRQPFIFSVSLAYSIKPRDVFHIQEQVGYPSFCFAQCWN